MTANSDACPVTCTYSMSSQLNNPIRGRYGGGGALGAQAPPPLWASTYYNTVNANIDNTVHIYAYFFLSKWNIVRLTNVALNLAAALNFSPEFTQCTTIQPKLCKWYSNWCTLTDLGTRSKFCARVQSAHIYGQFPPPSPPLSKVLYLPLPMVGQL